MIGRKGLFGKGLGNMMGSAMIGGMPDMANIPSTAQGRYGNAMLQPAAPARQPGFWQGGNKFTVRDGIAGALAAIGDGLSSWAGGGGGATQFLMSQRMEPQRLAEEQRRRAADLADFRTQMQIRSEFEQPQAQAPRFEQDGAGNIWRLDPVTGRPMDENPVFIDRTERIINQNGALVRIPNPYNRQGVSGTVSQSDWDSATPMGGTTGNRGGNFPR